MILQVMGRDSGFISLYAAVAGNADVALIPEIPYSIDGIIDKIKRNQAAGKHYAIIVVAEGVKTEKGESILASYNDNQVRYGSICRIYNDKNQ